MRAVGDAERLPHGRRGANRRLSLHSPIGWLVDWLERGAPREKRRLEYLRRRPPKVSKAEREGRRRR